VRNKKLLWVLWAVILVVLSVGVMAIPNPFSGLGGFSIIHVLVNSVLIGLFLFLLSILLGEKGKAFFGAEGKTAKGVFVVVLIVLSVFFAFKIGGQYIWSQAVVKDFWAYLFDADGILRSGQKLFVFIVGSLLFAWLLRATVKVGGEKKSKIDYALAIMIGADLARRGMSRNSVILLGQIISIILLTKQFGAAEKRNKVTGFIWSFGLVTWISAIAFPKVGLGIVFSGFIRAFGYSGHVWYILIFIFGGLLFGGVLWSKLKDKDKKEGYGTMDNIKDYIKRPFTNWFNKTNIPILRRLLAAADIRDITPGGTEKTEWAWPVREMWVELMTQLNYLLRLEVYTAKGYAVKFEREKMLTEYARIDESPEVKHYMRSQINLKIDSMGNGTDFELTPDGKGFRIAKPGTKNSIRRNYCYFNNNGEFLHSARVEPMYGEYSSHFLILQFFKTLGEQLETRMGGISPSEEAKVEEAMGYVEADLIKALKSVNKQMAANAGRRKAHMKRRGSFNKIHNSRLHYLDQYMLSGQYKHVYKFARTGGDQGNPDFRENIITAPGPQVYSIPYTVDTTSEPPFYIPVVDDAHDLLKLTETQRRAYEYNGSDYYGTSNKYIENGKVKKVGEKPDEGFIEVDHEGYFLDDYNDIKINGPIKAGGARRMLRRVLPYEKVEVRNSDPKVINRYLNAHPGADPRDYPKEEIWVSNVMHLPKHSITMKRLDLEWDFYVIDIKEGSFHPLSRTALDYTSIHAQTIRKKFKKGTKQTHGRPDEGKPALDREAFLDPGRFIYWGRKNVEDEEKTDVNIAPLNPFPTVSTMGMSNYISDYIYRFADKIGIEQRKLFIWASGREEPFTGQPSDKGESK